MATDRYRWQFRVHAAGAAVLAASLVLASFACSSIRSFYVKIDGLAVPTAVTTKRYLLVPGSVSLQHVGVEGILPTDLRFKEFARYVRKALTSHGYKYTDDPTQAEVAIFMNYGMGEPQTNYGAYSEPVITKVSGGTSTSSATTSGAGGTSHTIGTITEQDQYGVVGTETTVGTSTAYFSYLILTATDIHASIERQEIVKLWRTTATSEGSTGDLRRVFPVLVAAAQPHIGTDTGQQVSVYLWEDDERVLAIKSANPPGPAAAGQGLWWWED